MKTTLQVLAVVVAIIAGLHATKINKCTGDDAPSIENIKVVLGNCEDEEPCVLNRGESYNFTQEFIAPKNADYLESYAIGTIYRYEVQVNSANDPDACESIQGTHNDEICPLKEGQTYIYGKLIEISMKEIKANINIEWYLVSGNDTLTCFQIPLKIQDKSE